jgi:inner membrane protein
MWLVLITHPLLDTMTVYGTQLLMPFTDHPFGIGSVFIIDPAYTLPLIAGVVAALRMKDRGRGLRWNAAALVLSTLYLGWSAFAQQHVDRVARASLQEQGIAAQGLLVTPAPFSTVLWRLVATTPDRYFEGYYSLFDARPTVRWTAYPRGAALIEQHGDNDSVARIAAFSHGFFSLQALDGHLMLTDLRMGQEPAYIFRFDVGALDAVGAQPPTQLGMRADLGRSLPWLWERLLGTDVPLPVDANRDSTAVAANP